MNRVRNVPAMLLLLFNVSYGTEKADSVILNKAQRQLQLFSRGEIFRSYRISCPSAFDSTRAAQPGVSAGGQIMIHGQRNELRWFRPIMRYIDWTAGCIAVTNVEVDDIWGMVDVGTPIKINP